MAEKGNAEHEKTNVMRILYTSHNMSEADELRLFTEEERLKTRMAP